MITKEDVSAFTDNELSEFEERHLLKELKENKELRSAWGRYHVIRAAMRKDLEKMASPDLSSAIAQAIAREPYPHSDGKRLRAIAFAKIAGGVALAASVATVAVLSLQTPPVPTQALVAQTPEIQAAQVIPVQQDASLKPSVPIGAAAEANSLNNYLIRHNESTSTTGVGGLLPYVRMVGHEESR